MTIYPDICLRKRTSGKPDHWEVTLDCLCPDDIIIPRGFITDFASIPRAFWWFLPPHGKAANAAILHDYRYVHCVGSDKTTDWRARYRADLLFLRDMIDHHVPGWQAWLMYQAVRWAGMHLWMKHKKRLSHAKNTE